jgi:alkylation response protein AidB-like acyl-CoA dehydrogenase
MLVQVKLEGNHRPAMFFVDIPSTGLRVVRDPLYMHTYALRHPMVALEQVRVPAANLIDIPSEAMASAMAEAFRDARLKVAARCCGAAERLLEESVSFAKQRVQFGEPISNYQAIQFMLADSFTEWWTARLAVLRAADSLDEGAPPTVTHVQCSMAKLQASEMVGRVADRAVQIFGGRGYMRENAVERLYREVRVERIWDGTSEIQRLIVARHLVSHGMSAFGSKPGRS